MSEEKNRILFWIHGLGSSDKWAGNIKMHQNGRHKEFNSSYILNIFDALKTAQGTIWDTKTRNIQLCPQGTHKQ